MEENKPATVSAFGAIRIADEVVSTVAGLAAMEVEGVASMSGGWGTELVEKLGKKNLGKGIKVEVTEHQTKIDIDLVIEYGYEIPKVADTVQHEVREAVQNMTGLEVIAVNINIVGVELKKDDKNDVITISENE
ncbi:MAG: Asp23/Gls24 family envelope stress response protein [Syntrophomonadaceae bacterium]|jgi:uncharacterized alkaline shock family protein YloU|nr:Asp23/Gls24 family envelope stress response protein [Syntrophomonadaceae bacterium]